MDESEETGTQSNAYEKRNLKSYKGKNLPTTPVKVYILESYFDSLDDFDLSDDEANKITSFAFHIQKNGFKNLEGRNKQSNEVPTSDKDFLFKTNFAIQHTLHHYHVGVEQYSEGEYGDKTSKFLVHYSFDDSQQSAKIICVNKHPKFTLPKIQQINSKVEEQLDIE